MAHGDIFRISSGAPDRLISLSLSYDYNDRSDEPIVFQFNVSGTSDSGDLIDASIIAEADTIRNNLIMRFGNLTPLAACLIGCAGTTLVKPLVTCINGDRAAYIDCVKAKGVEIAYDVGICCSTCLQVGP